MLFINTNSSSIYYQILNFPYYVEKRHILVYAE